MRGGALRQGTPLEDEADSVDRVCSQVLWHGLENTRTAFKQYQANVGQFKVSPSRVTLVMLPQADTRLACQAGVIGFHAAGHGLSAEDEIASLSRVMGDFRYTLAEVKSKGRMKRAAPSHMELPETSDEQETRA